MGIAGIWLSIAIDLCVRAVFCLKFRKMPDKVSSQMLIYSYPILTNFSRNVKLC